MPELPVFTPKEVPPRRPRRLLPFVLFALMGVPFFLVAGGVLLLAHLEEASHAWIDVGREPIASVAPRDGRLVDGSISGCASGSCRSETAKVYATSAEEEVVDADLDRQIAALGFSRMRATERFPAWRPLLPRTRQARKGELTIRWFFAPTPYGRGQKGAPPIGVDQGPRVVVVEVDNTTAIDEGVMPKRKP